MKTRFIGLLVAGVVGLAAVGDRIQAATLTWTNNASGSWHDAGNWSPNQVPGAADVAVFNRNVTLTVNEDVSVAGLQCLSSGTINVSTGVLTVATLTWNGGWLRGTIQSGGGSIGVGTTKYLVGGTLVNAGTLNWADTIYLGTDGYSATNYGVISNLVGGVINVTADVNVNGHYTGGFIYNAGTLNKSGGTGTANFYNGVFYNSGSLAISSGTLNLANSGGSSGSMTVSAGNTLQFGSGTFTNEVGSTVTGAGNLLVSGGAVNFNGGYNLAGTNTFTAGATTFNGNYNLSGPVVITSGGAYFNNAGVGVVNVPTLAMTGGGTLGGSNAVVAASFTWNGGWLRVPLNCGGGSIGAGTTKYLVGGVLNNAGTLTWADSIWMGSDGYQVTNFGVISNLTSGVVNMTADVSINSHYTGGYLYNAGQLNKTGGAGTANFYSGVLFNSGSVAINSGALNLAAGGASSGSATVNAGSTLLFGGGAFTLETGSITSGAGNLWVSSGTVNFNGGYNLTGTNTFTSGTANFNGNYNLSGPVIITSGAAYFNNAEVGVVNVPTLAMTGGGGIGGTNSVTASSFTWNGGWLRVALNCGGGSIGGGTTKYLVGGVLNNAGTLTWTDSIWMGSDGYAATNFGVISNLASGVINITADVNINSQYTGGYLYNAGQLNKTGGTGTANFYSGALFNSGSVAINSGALNLANGGGSSGNATVIAGSTLLFGGGTFTLEPGSTLTGAGNLWVSSGTANFNGGYNLTGTNTFTGGNANFNGNYNLSGPVVITSGAAYFNNVGVGVVNVPTLAMTGGGGIGGTNSVTASSFIWNGGWLRVALNCGGGSIGGGTTKYLVGGVLNNAGTLTWADSIWMGSDGYAATNFGVLSNLVGGVINIMADVAINSHYTGGFLYNAGQLNKTGGTGTANFHNGTLYNSGSVAINSGTLNVAAGGASSGSVVVVPGATLYFSSNFNFNDGSVVGGGGAFTVASSTVNFNGTALFTNTIASLTGGSLYFNNSPGGPTTIPTLVMTGSGVLGGSNSIYAGAFTWNGGWIRALLTCGGGNIGAGTTKYLVGGTLLNAGSLTWVDSIWMGSDGYAATNFGVISNLVGGVINLTADVNIYSHYTGGLLYNAGALNKTGGTGTANFHNGTLYDNGSLAVQSGTLNLAAGGRSSGQSSISPGATLYFSSNFDFNDDSIVGGGGGFTVASGTVNFNGTALFTNTIATLSGGSVYFNNTPSGALTIPNLVMTGGGTLGGTNSVTTGNLTWNGGALRLNLTTALGSIGSGTTKYIVGGTLINAGTLTMADSLYMGTDGYAATNYGVISNLVSGIVNVTSDLGVYAYYNNGLVYNLGDFNKTAGTGNSISSTFHNYGTLNAQVGTFNFSTTGGLVSHDGTMALGLTSTNAHGRITASGTVGLNGTLRAEPRAGYVPQVGDRFTLLTASARTNTFAQLQLGQTPGVAWQVNYAPAAVSLTALAATAGSQNISGTVTDFNAQPVGNLIVYAFNTSGTNQYYVSTATDGSGQYTLGVTNGNWRVSVQGAVARGYDDPTPQDVAVSGAAGTANFVLAPYSGAFYSIVALNNPPGAGYVSGAGNYYAGTTNAITALASNGYYFTNWTESSVVISTSNTLVFTATTNRTFVANYGEAHPYHNVTLATSPTNLTSLAGAGTYTNGETGTFVAPLLVLSGSSNYFFQRFTLTNVTASASNNFNKTFSTLDSTNLHYVAVYAGLRTNPVVALVSPSRSGVIPTNDNFTITFRFDRPMNTNVTPVVTLTNIVSGGVSPVVVGAGTWGNYWQVNDSYTTPALVITNGLDGTNLVYISGASDTNGGTLLLTNAYTFAVDTVYPTLTQIAAAPGINSSVITWNSDEPANGIVDYGLSPALGTTSYGSSGITNHSLTLYSLIASTTYHYRVRSVDVAGNTTVSATGTFTTLAAPDLLVTNLNVTGNLVSGGALTISWADTNAGSGATFTYWYDQIVVSNLTTGAQLLSTTLYHNPTVNGDIAAGGAQVRSVNLTLPDGNAGVGNLQITVIADVYNYQYEFNAGGTAENNNRATFNVVSGLAAYPDLQISGLAITNASLQSGRVVGLMWQDQNTGAGGVSNSFADRVIVVNATNNQTLVNALLPYAGGVAGNSSIARQFAFTLPDGPTGAGELLITVVADAANAIYEFNGGGTAESNNTNTLAATAALAPYPDLIVTNILAPLTATAGQTIQLVWSDMNQGSAPATNSWYDQVFLSNSNGIGGGQLLATFNITNGLTAGQSLTLTQNVTLPAFVSGTNWLIVKANVAAAFYEGSLTNNAAIATNATTLDSALQLTLSPNTVSEAAGNSAVLVSVSRNGGLTAPLTVNLSSTLTNVLLPASVVIPVGVSSTNFYLGVVDNNFAGDTIAGLVTASASGFASRSADLTITDNDVAALTLALSATEIAEDAGTNAVSVLITRNNSLASPLIVSLASDRPDVLIAPVTVTIPAGNAAATFQLTPQPDGILAGSRRARVTATASGFTPVSAAVDVLNTDSVQLGLTLTDSVVSEGAGNNAALGTVTRSVVTAAAQKVQLTRMGSPLVSMPGQVTIPANSASVNFNVSVGADGLVTGAQQVFIIANPLNQSNVPDTIGEAQVELQVLDTNGPSLNLQFAATVISKGSNTLATLIRNTPATNALAVTLSAAPTNVISFPPTVNFALGQTSVTFTVTGVLDGLQTGNRDAVLTAAVAGFNSAAKSITVSDIYLPDLVPAIVSVPTSAYTEQQITVTWRVSNVGLGATTNQNWFDYVYLATDGVGGGQTLFAAKQRVQALGVGESYTNSAGFYLSTLPGNFWIIVEANGNRTATELKTANNSVFAPSPVAVNAAYRAELLSATPALAAAGTPIVLQGRTYNPTNNTLLGNRSALVRVFVNGTRRAFPVTSDAGGNFNYTFQPLANEAGDYLASADHPSVADPTNAQTSFTLLGMAIEPSTVSQQLLPNTPVAGTLLLSNLSSHALSGLALNTPDLSTNLTAQFTFTNTTLPPDGVIGVNYTLQSPLTRAAQLNFFATVTSTEGATRAVPMYIKVVPTLAQLVATPSYLQRGMVRGEQTVVSFTIENNGGTASGDLTVQLPSLPWLSHGSVTNIPSIPAGSNTVVTLLLNPAADLTLGLYNGNIAVFNQNVGVTIPYQFRAVSSGIGDLTVNVTDDYTYYVAGEPKVTNATVVLRDPFTGSIVAQTNSGATGVAHFGGLTEGGYTVDVSAEKHNQFRGTATIVAGTTNMLEAFLPRQLVTYQWSVVPTEIEDKYKIVLESVFETEVPVPNVVIEEPQVMLVVAPGEVSQFEIKLTNHGLIAANDVTIDVPYNSTYLVTPLVQNVGKIPAKSSVTVPVTVQLRETAGGLPPMALAGARSDGPQAADGGGCTLEDINGCLPKIGLSAKYSYPCGGNNVGQSRSLDLSIICASKSAKECFDELKGLVGSANLISVGCNAINAFLACVGADLTACQKAAISTACGAALGGLAGAAGAGAGGILECICSHLDDIPFPSFGGGSSPQPGGGVLLPILPTGGYYAVGNPVVTYIYIPGGNCGGSSGAALASASVTSTGYNPSSAPRLMAPAKANASSGVCARVRLRINQEVVMTRSAFVGTLEIENGGLSSITGVQVTLDFRDGGGTNAANKFVIEGPVLSGLTAVDGTGELAGGDTGSSVYTFIPTTDAAPNAPRTYQIGGTLRYIDDGQEVVVPLLSAPITVYPEAKLDLIYFQQRDVYGDDPFTLPVEPSEPYTLGLIAKNIGAGDAKNFEITSAQPQIIENEKGLLIDFRILGTRVGSNAISPSLTAKLGNIPAGMARTVTWDLISTLQGKFISFEASFEHVDGLGRTNLSLINSVETHELTRAVRANRVTDDGIVDFLVNDFADPQNLPDLLYLNTGAVEPVNVVANGSFDAPAGPGHLQVQLTTVVSNGWNYFRLPDPGAGYLLASVVRSDGKVLALTNNAWTTDRTFPSSSPGAIKENLVHLFDWAGSGQYTLTYRSTNTATPSIVQFVPVTPFTQTGAVATVTIIFSEQMNLATFNHSALTLKHDGGTNLITASSGVTVTSAGGNSYTINGLSALTGADGNYTLTVSGHNLFDVWGNNVGDTSASISWAKGNAAPVVESITAVTPDPRNTPVASLLVTFSKAINPATFTLEDLALTLDGGANLIGAGVSITTADNIAFAVSGLGGLTGGEGHYAFTVNAATVTDGVGAAGLGTQTVAWEMITSAPQIVALPPVNTNPRNIVVQNLDVTFSHPINPATFTFADLVLTRNGGPNLISSNVTVTALNATSYRISEISWVQGSAGNYSFTVNAAGIQDLAGNSGTGSTNITWQMILDTPPTPTNLIITPDLGISATDGLTSTNPITLAGNVAGTNLTIRVFDESTSTDLGVATVNDTNFSASLLFAAPGTHRLKVTAVDGAGNVSAATYKQVVWDQVRPSASIGQVVTPIYAGINSVTFTFTEGINPATISAANFVLTRDGTNVLTPPFSLVASNVAQLAGLTALTEELGVYQVTANLNGVADYAGNTATNLLTMSWLRDTLNQPPIITPITNMIVTPDGVVHYPVEAFDPNGDELTFSLAAGAPTNAVIVATNGVFRWRPTRANASTTRNLTVVVTDNGNPPMSASNTFAITVLDYLDVSLGNTNLLGGGMATLPVVISSSEGVSNVQFRVAVPFGVLTNWTLVSESAQLGAATLQTDAASFTVNLQTLPGQFLQGTQQVSRLEFTATTNSLSQFLPLQLAELGGIKPGGVTYSNNVAGGGRVVVVQEHPLLEGLVLSNQTRQLVFYGRPGTNYQLHIATNAMPPINWQPVTTFNQTNVLVPWPVGANNGMFFYRLEQVP